MYIATVSNGISTSKYNFYFIIFRLNRILTDDAFCNKQLLQELHTDLPVVYSIIERL